MDDSYSVIKSNCGKLFFSGEPKNSEKWPNPIIFGKLICGGFGILMSQYGQVKKVVPLRAVPKW